MQNHLTIALVQANLVWGNTKKNCLEFSKKLTRLDKPVDLIILPEMFTTGFSMKPQNIAESMQGYTVRWMQEVASKMNAAIGGSVIISEDNNFYNRFLFVHPSGELNFYDKKHLFTLAGEHEIYASGKEKLKVNYKGWKICPLICYDLRFPVWARNMEAYDVLIYVANWPKPRISAWDILLKARAIENMCYTIGVNRVGIDANNLEYSGHSAAYDCLGEQVASTTENVEEIAIVTLEKKHISAVRNKLNFLNDRDSFIIIK